MGKALIKFRPQCAACEETVEVEFFVLDTPERFCSLVCAKIYFAYPIEYIRQQRREKAC